MDPVVAWIVGLTIFFGLVLALFFVITRSTRAILGPRRRCATSSRDHAPRSGAVSMSLRISTTASGRWSGISRRAMRRSP